MRLTRINYDLALGRLRHASDFPMHMRCVHGDAHSELSDWLVIRGAIEWGPR